jgi:gas vesicle protein
MRRGINFVLGAMLGALVGASVAILMAPSSGEDLREEISGRFGRFVDEVQEAAEDRRAELERQLKNLRQPQPSGIPLEEN